MGARSPCEVLEEGTGSKIEQHTIVLWAGGLSGGASYSKCIKLLEHILLSCHGGVRSRRKHVSPVLGCTRYEPACMDDSIDWIKRSKRCVKNLNVQGENAGLGTSEIVVDVGQRWPTLANVRQRL